MADGVLENVPVVGVKRTFPRSFGRYILEKSLSRGGMGEVFLTIAKAVNQRCVIKTIRGDLTGDEEFIGRFADEAKIMMRIQHENIIRVFDAGKVGTDYYIAMEYVHGRDLGDVLDRAYERGEPMPTQLGLYIAQKLLEGMDYAHKLVDEHGRPMGVVHRDISPQNVLVGFDGAIKLIDFGLARTDLLPARTQGALAVGKYGYMSPEQARHERIDGRADIYSTGVMLFEVFTGDRLVDEQDQATLWSRVLNPKHRKPSTVIHSLAPAIDELVMTAVAVRADDRFRDAAGMRDFVQSLRSEKSNRDDLIRYLHYLYPKVDFTAPPIPDFGNQFDESEKSMIIATSREGAMSVFGRGELPIEWTTQIDAAELQAAFARYRVRLNKEKDKQFERDARTEAHKTPDGPDTEDGEADTGRPRRRGDGEKKAALAELEAPTAEHMPTQVAELESVGVDINSAETRYMRGPTREPKSEDIRQSAGVDLATEHNVEALGSTRVAHQFRDDEMTVMMDAPPRSALRMPISDFPEEDTRDGDAPTRLSEVPGEPSATLPPVSRGRAIQERNVRDRAREERTNLRDRTDRAPERTARPVQVQKVRAAVAHRATVGTDAGPQPKKGEDTMPPIGQPEYTEPERSRSVDITIAFIVVGLIVVLILLVMVLFRV
jgi:serine/threonine protein kinase